jgi:hypothetical protein
MLVATLMLVLLGIAFAMYALHHRPIRRSCGGATSLRGPTVQATRQEQGLSRPEWTRNVQKGGMRWQDMGRLLAKA